MHVYAAGPGSRRTSRCTHSRPHGPGQGFYAAKALGYYEENGLDVTFISAHEDGFTTLPAERIDRKEVHFGIAPSETVVSYNVRPGSFHKSHMKVRAARGAAAAQRRRMRGAARGALQGWAARAQLEAAAAGGG